MVYPKRPGLNKMEEIEAPSFLIVQMMECEYSIKGSGYG